MNTPPHFSPYNPFSPYEQEEFEEGERDFFERYQEFFSPELRPTIFDVPEVFDPQGRRTTFAQFQGRDEGRVDTRVSDRQREARRRRLTLARVSEAGSPIQRERSGLLGSREIPRELPRVQESTSCAEVLPERGGLFGIGEPDDWERYLVDMDECKEEGEVWQLRRSPGGARVEREGLQRLDTVWAEDRSLHERVGTGTTTFINESLERVRYPVRVGPTQGADLVWSNQHGEDNTGVLSPTPVHAYPSFGSALDLYYEQAGRDRAGRYEREAPTRRGTDSSAGHCIRDTSAREIPCGSDTEGDTKNYYYEPLHLGGCQHLQSGYCQACVWSFLGGSG